MYKSITNLQRITIEGLKIKNSHISAKYTVIDAYNNTESFTIHFSYKPEIEKRFIEPFAGLIVSAPAINYALFSEEIIFDVPLSSEEIDFIKLMCQVTAKDILVNKFINKTKFIKEDVRENLLREIESIELSLSDLCFPNKKIKMENYSMDTNKALILSSGGKESLLSYGFLKEAGFVTYPAFFNESGRHWLTAITAYREFSERDKNTLKVWSNVDRLYNFFLRKLTFIKSNYWKINKDTYPIRLFIFGPYIVSFLPYIIKESIGNILLGNEFDDTALFANSTNVKKGFTHYYGIYDQTAEFDKAVTEFLNRDGVHVTQWSIVRALSGFLVEKILGKNFHDLFMLQHSCHNVHIEGGRITPCGKCRKCLGVELYLAGNGLNGEKIGYKREDIEQLLTRLEKTKLGLDEKEFQHALFNTTGGKKGKEFKEIETLQFNTITSPIENIPVYARGKVIPTLLAYVPEVYFNGMFFSKDVFVEKEIWK